MKKILVPTDFSDPSRFAIISAARLAAKTKAQLIILHVLDEPEDSNIKQQELEKIFQIEELKNVDHHYLQGLGDAVEVIIEQEADLIVMGSRGAKGLKSFFVGTNAEKVAKNASCPVITIKSKTDLANIRSIVFPTNMDPEDVEVIPYIKDLQALYKARLHLIKVYDDTLVLEKDVEKRLTDYAEFHKFSNYSVSASAGIDQADLILKFAEDSGAGMIAMATHDWHGMERLVGGYISGEVINTSKIAIWTKSLKTD